MFIQIIYINKFYSCLLIGKRFAEFEMKMALFEVLTNYEVMPRERTNIPIKHLIQSVSNVPKIVWLKFRKFNFNIH